MSEYNSIEPDLSETIQDIAIKLVIEQKKNEKSLNGPTEKTIFVLGSKGVVSFIKKFYVENLNNSILG